MWYDVIVQHFSEIYTFSILTFNVCYSYYLSISDTCFSGDCPHSPFILGGSDGWDVGCGLATWMEIKFPTPHKSKHS